MGLASQDLAARLLPLNAKMLQLDCAEGALWARWQQERSSAVRDALIAHYSPWARRVARDVFIRIPLMGDTWSDCVQNALIGLMQAMERFDPQRGGFFEPFARPRVRGAVFDGLRNLREVHKELHFDAGYHVSMAAERLESLNEDRDDDSLEAFVAATVGLGLGFLLDLESMPGGDSMDAYAQAEKAELSKKVSDSINRLVERDRTVVILHYYHQLPFVEIADRLGLTKGRVSQLHKRALHHLRSGLREHVLAEY